MTTSSVLDKPKQTRLVHIDAIRGLMMLLVMCVHLGSNSDLMQILRLVRMPLFITISGFLVFSADYDSTKVRQKSLNRIVKQLYPTIFLWLLWNLLFCIKESQCFPSAITLISNPFKNAFWFTFVLVEYFFIALPWLILFNRMQWRNEIVALLLVNICVVFIFLENVIDVLFTKYWFFDLIGNSLSFKLVVRWGAFFFLGMIAKIYHNYLEEIGQKWIVLVLALVCFVFSAEIYFVIHDPWISRLARYISGISGMLTIYCIFLHLSSSVQPLLQKVIYYLSIVGRKTLEIYLLHFFILLLYGDYIFGNLGLDNIMNTWYGFPVIFSIAIGMAFVIIIFVAFLRLIGLYEFIFPQKTEKLLTVYNIFKNKLKLSIQA